MKNVSQVKYLKIAIIIINQSTDLKMPLFVTLQAASLVLGRWFPYVGYPPIKLPNFRRLSPLVESWLADIALVSWTHRYV